MDKSYLGVDHLGVAVKDLTAALHTYRDVLGFAHTGDETLPERGLEVAFIDTGNARIELIAPTRDDSEVSAFLHKRGEGIHHICVRVKDLEGSLERLRAAGAPIVGSGVQRGAHGRKVAFVHPKGTHGVLLELVEIPEG